MEYFVDVSFDSLNKYGEELCGDKVEIIRAEDYVIVVLADGLGSGVKANILSTLTSKIAGTMLMEGADIYETVDTIANTLPVCNIRHIAYSTFTILKIFRDGRVYAAEYDNPPYFLIRNGQVMDIEKSECVIGGKVIKESNFNLNEGDTLVVVSDGAIHAGVGAVLNLGWQWDNVADYLKETVSDKKCVKDISANLADMCMELYMGMPGDDTTVVAVQIKEEETIDLFTGPPEDEAMDRIVIKRLMGGKGKKIVCGGTAAKIASRELGEDLVVNMELIDSEIPPTARIKGIDLVTEGVLTLNKTIEKIKCYMEQSCEGMLDGNDGASQLSRMLVEECTHLNLWVGKAVNPAHQNPDFPLDLRIKLNIVIELAKLMKKLGKRVSLTYI